MSSPRIHAPELAGAVEWFNVAAPLTLKKLRGKVVLLDFWTYGCINCLHILPDLKRLEAKYRQELVVIGIHSAKFTNERESENIRRIIVRYDIDHPVANDATFAIWKAYGARSWPTQVLIDPEGYVVATASGEGKGEAFDRAIAAVIHVFDEQHRIDRTPLPLSPERERVQTSTLAFPGKVLADEASGRLVIADSSHHRVIVSSLEGRVTDVIGSGEFGRADGTFEEAQFYRPQGLALDGDRLYVADTENHLVRVADLATRQVETVAGTGKQAAWGGDGGAARETALSSPWDLQLSGRLLFVAMAGTHQIWVIDRERGLALRYAGSGREARVDGPADEAAFAQPSGLARDADTLYVADSESNIIRAIALPPTNDVRTLAGGDLFEFGDCDGLGDDVRLQHPLGVAWLDGRLFIADTYNHRIKVLDPRTRKVTVFAGTGQPGARDGAPSEASFYEPGGLSAASEAIFVADTNNHAVRSVQLSNSRVTTVQLVFRLIRRKKRQRMIQVNVSVSVECSPIAWGLVGGIVRIRTLASLAVGTALMTFIAAPALAQTSSGGSNQAVFAAGLSFLHVNGTTGTGFDVNVAKPFMSSGKMNTGIFGDFAWHTSDGEHALAFLVGPRFAHTGSSQFTPFFQVGLGVTNFSCDGCDSVSAFTFAPGGGVDVKLNDKVNFRFQLDIPVMKSDGDTETGVRFTFGISLPIGSK